MNLNTRQRNTIIAALRLWQSEGFGYDSVTSAPSFLSDILLDGTDRGLTDAEIDDLIIEVLQFGRLICHNRVVLDSSLER